MVSFANTMLSHLAYQNKPDFTYLRQISGVAHIRVQCVQYTVVVVLLIVNLKIIKMHNCSINLIAGNRQWRTSSPRTDAF